MSPHEWRIPVMLWDLPLIFCPPILGSAFLLPSCCFLIKLAWVLQLQFSTCVSLTSSSLNSVLMRSGLSGICSHTVEFCLHAFGFCLHAFAFCQRAFAFCERAFTECASAFFENSYVSSKRQTSTSSKWQYSGSSYALGPEF